MKHLLLSGLLLCSLYSAAQAPFPKSREEDKDGIMSEAYWKIWNPEVQSRIDKDIERYRMADAEVCIPDVAEGADVKVEQASHDFVFGAHIFNFNQLGTSERNKKYKEVYGSLFNSATIAFYWKTFETEPGKLRFKEERRDTEEYWNNCPEPKLQPHWRRPAADPVVEFCESKNIRMHGHPLIWGNRKWQHPEWILQKFANKEERDELNAIIKEFGNIENYRDYETYADEYDALAPRQLEERFPEYAKELNRLFAKRITDIASYYKGRINSWDVVNESASDYEKGLVTAGDGFCKSVYGLMPGDYVHNAFQTAAKAFPDSVALNINDYNLGQCYADEVKGLLARGCKIDILGSQMHLFNPQQCLDIAEGKDIQTPQHVWGWAERLGSVGLPIHLSEITITAPGDDARGRQIQAIIAQNLYRIWFSFPQMMGITWWNVVDDCGAPGEPSTSGLFDRDMQPKPSFYALDNLINNEWKTRLALKAPKDGKIRFRGFKGEYRITWKDKSGKEQTINYHLK